jgi:hypothetical protein
MREYQPVFILNLCAKEKDEVRSASNHVGFRRVKDIAKKDIAKN